MPAASTLKSEEIIITAKDRVGLLKDISDVFCSIKINIQNVKMKKDSGYSKIHITFNSKNKEQTQKIKTKLKTIKNVEQVVSSSKS